jgi:hypothetical protein
MYEETRVYPEVDEMVFHNKKILWKILIGVAEQKSPPPKRLVCLKLLALCVISHNQF